MGTAAQIVFIGCHIYLIGYGFSIIGKPSTAPNRHFGTGVSASLYSLFTIAFLIWWDIPDPTALIGMIAAITLMWGPWIYDLPEIHKPYPIQTLKNALIGALICTARIGVVLGFWTLY